MEFYLPSELWFLVFSKLDHPDQLRNCSWVDKRWYSIINENSTRIWKLLCFQSWHLPEEENNVSLCATISWREAWFLSEKSQHQGMETMIERLQKLTAEKGEVAHLGHMESVGIPNSLFKLTSSVKSLFLDHNHFISIPPTVGLMTSLHILDLSSNLLKDIPSSLSSLKNLKALNLSNNRFDVLPEVVSSLRNLEWLSLAENQLQELPSSLSNLSHISYLHLGNNKLTSIPPELVSSWSGTLTWLNIANNKLTEIPGGFLQLTRLAHLSIQNNVTKFSKDRFVSLSLLERIVV